jgi:hypothetical protein
MFPRRRIAALLTLVAFVSFAKEKEPAPPPRAFHAKTYPAVDAHTDEKVAIAADPFDLPDKTGWMQVPYRGEDVLPIRVIVSNDSDHALNLSEMQVLLTTVNPRAKVQPMEPLDLYRRLGHQAHRPDEQRPNPLPIPLPRSKPKPLVKKEWQDEVESLHFKWLAVEPHTSVDGFLFFDIRDLDHPLAGGHLVLTGVHEEDGKELFYFDIALEKYLSYQPNHP